TRQATAMLLLVTFMWGLSFPLMKRWLVHAFAAGCPRGKAVATLTLIAVRTLLSVLILAVCQPRLFLRPDRREFSIGLLIGFLNFLGFGLQVWGLCYTTPALSAFYTSL